MLHYVRIIKVKLLIASFKLNIYVLSLVNLDFISRTISYFLGGFKDDEFTAKTAHRFLGFGDLG